MKLHLGCGPRILEGWENLDIAPGEGASFGDATNLDFGDGTVSHIYCEDMFEHLDQREQFDFLNESYRVLEPGGFLRISCPELWSSLTRMRIDEVLWGNPWKWGHLCIPTPEYLEQIANWVGFDISFGGRNDGMAYGFPEDLRPFVVADVDENSLAELGHIFALLRFSTERMIGIRPT